MSSGCAVGKERLGDVGRLDRHLRRVSFACTSCPQAIWARIRRFSVSGDDALLPKILVSCSGVIFRFLASEANASSTRASGMTMPCFLALEDFDDLVDQLVGRFLDAALLARDLHELGALGNVEAGDRHVVDEHLDRAVRQCIGQPDAGPDQGGHSDDAEGSSDFVLHDSGRTSRVIVHQNRTLESPID